MPSNKPVFTFRTDKAVLDKLHKIAEMESRTSNKQLEYILLNYIKRYEENNGKIKAEGT